MYVEHKVIDYLRGLDGDTWVLPGVVVQETGVADAKNGSKRVREELRKLARGGYLERRVENSDAPVSQQVVAYRRAKPYIPYHGVVR